MDRSTVLGILLGLALIFIAIVIQGEVGAFLSLSSLLIVLGGVTSAVMVNFSLSHIKDSFSTISSMVGLHNLDLRTDLELLRMFNRRVRSNGLLTLDGEIKHLKSDFLRNGLQLAVDGFQKESLDEIMKNEIESRERQLNTSVTVLNAMAEYSPAFGMIGTLIGMVLMLQNVTDPEQLGAGLSIALITTLYGTILSNLIFGPLAGKLDHFSKVDLNRKQMHRIGILSMVDGENPRIMEKKMIIYLEPQYRSEYLQHHEELHLRRQRDQKLYNRWIEYQNKEWKALIESLEAENG